MNQDTQNKKSETLDNCIAIVSKTLKEATNTSVEIKTQGEQFQKMDNTTEDIKKNSKKADKILDKMLYYVGYLKEKTYKVVPNRLKKTKSNQIVDSSLIISAGQLQNDKMVLEDFCEEDIIQDFKIKPITPEEKHNLEQDKKLETLYALTKQLKDINLCINKELDQQNQTLEELDTKVEDRVSEIKILNRKVKNFLR